MSDSSLNPQHRAPRPPGGRNPSHSAPPFLTIGRLASAVALSFVVGLVPPAPFETSLFALRLVARPAPEHVAMPVDGVRPTSLRDSWGAPRGGGRRHEGIDIFAPRGTAVLAATDGLVRRIGTDPLGGRVVWVLGPGGQMHYYAHLDRYASGLAAGDRIAAGDPLGTVGTVGNSGNAAGGPTHLHYGIYAAGGATDPFPLLRAAAGAS